MVKTPGLMELFRLEDVLSLVGGDEERPWTAESTLSRGSVVSFASVAAGGCVAMVSAMVNVSCEECLVNQLTWYLRVDVSLICLLWILGLRGGEGGYLPCWEAATAAVDDDKW